MIDPLTMAQADIVARIAADDLFSTITLISEDTGVSESDVETALGGRYVKGGKQGAVVIVFQPNAKVEGINEPEPTEALEFIIRAMEIPKMNRAAGGTKVTALQMALRIQRLLHYWSNGSFRFSVRRRERYNDGEGTIGFDITASIESNPAYMEPVLKSLSVITGGALPAATVNITSPDSGVAIYYTTDGSFPSATNAVAHLYSTTLTLTTACTLRAAAYLAGNIASNTVAKQIN